MSIHVDVFARLHERELRRQTDALADRLEAAGTAGGGSYGDGFERGLARSSPKIQRAFNGIAQASAGVTKAAEAHRAAMAAGGKESDAAKAKFEQLAAAKRRLGEAETKAAKAADAHAKAVNASGEGSKEAAAAAETLTRARNREADAQGRVNTLHNEYTRIVNDGGAGSAKARIASEALANARRKEADAHRAAAAAVRDGVDGFVELERGAKKAVGGLQAFGKVSFQSLRGAGFAGLAAATPLLIDTAQAAVTATQSIYLLPAAITAAGTAFGTLKLATMGFADAIGDIKNADKFALDLANLSPEAQQAALSIRAILPELEAIQKASQNSFFDGFGPMFENLTATYGPEVQKLTTSVAGSFNTMAKDIADQLMTPAMVGNVSTIVDNISQTFTNLQPAASALSQAFVDMTATGSSFLPGLAKDISDAAIEFSNFISEARKSGQLAEWIREGIDAVKLLGDAIWILGQFIYDTFGKDGKQNVSDFADALQGLETITSALTGDFGSMGDSLSESMTIGADLRQELDMMTGVAGKFRDAIYNIPESFRALTNSGIDAANAITNALNKGPIAAINALIGGTTKLYNMLPGKDRPEDIGKIPDIPTIDRLPDEPYKPWNSLPENAPGGQFSDRNYSGPTDPTLTKPQEWTNPATGQKMVMTGQGWMPADQAGDVSKGPYAVPTPPPTDANGKVLSDKERRDQIAAGLDPSLYKVDPYASISGLPSGASAPGGAGLPGLGAPGAGGYSPRQQDILEAQHTLQSQAHDLEESTKARLALERDNTATAQELDDAKWKQLEDTWALQKAQADLADKIRGTSKSMKQGTSELGAALDPDLGLGQGLSGFAENMVRFLGNAALAPIFAKAQAEIDADPIKGGFGLLGINGAKNIAAGNSPLLGQPYSGASQATLGQTAFSSGLPGGYAGDAALLANVPRGIGKYDQGTKDLSQGLVDCASGVEDLVNIMDGKSTVGGSLWTGNAAQVLPGMGFRPGMGGPGDFRIGYNDHHLQATLPGNTNVNYGSTSAIQAGGLDGGLGAYDPSFTDHWFRPAGTTGPMIPGAGMPGLGMGSGGATPVFVTNMPGGGLGGAAGAMAAAFGGAQAAPGGGGGSASGLNWDALAQKEAGGNWANNSNPKYKGGLQFDQATWDSNGGQSVAPRADLASREDQIKIAEQALRSRGGDPSSLWPQNYKQLNTPASLAGVPNGPGYLGSSGPQDPLDFRRQIGGGNFNPNMKIDTSTTSVAPPYDPNRIGMHDIENMVNLSPNGPPEGQPGMGGLGFIGGPKQAPGTDMSSLDPNSPTGAGTFSPMLPGAAPTGLGMGGIDPSSSIGLGGAPGRIGPFPVPQSVVPGIGNSAPYGLGPGYMPPMATPGAMPGSQPNPTPIGGVTPGVAMGGDGGIGITPGGTLDTAISTAASAVPGLGQAAATGVKLGSRAIQYAGQLANIGISGLMETFLPTGGSELANSGWIPRIVGGLAGAKPALPNVAGGPAGGNQPQGPLDPNQVINQHAGDPGKGGDINVEYNSVGQTEDRNGKDLATHLGQMNGGSKIP